MREFIGHLIVGGIHLLIISTMVMMTILTLKLINSAPTIVERNLRYLALAGGLLFFFAADTLGIDLASLIFRSLSLSFPGKIAIVECGMPATAGAFSAWFLLRGIRESGHVGKVIKLLVMLTGFLLFTFADLYAASVQIKDAGRNLNLLPNVSFVLALILHFVFRYNGDVRDIVKSRFIRNVPSNGDWRTRV